MKIAEHAGYLCARGENDRENAVLRGVWPMRFHAKWNCWYVPFGPVALYLTVKAAQRADVRMEMSAELKRLYHALKESLELRKAFDAFQNPGKLVGIKTPPWRHQALAFTLFRDIPGFQLQMDMGTGKSMTALAMLVHWTEIREESIARRVLITCPKSVIDVWPDEFDKHMEPLTRAKFVVTPLNQRTVLAKVAAADRAEALAFQRGQVAVHVINYDAVWRPEMARWLNRKDIMASIMDEGHRVKSHNGKASRFLGELCFRSWRRMALTGTPMPHSPLDIIPQYRAISPDVFGSVWGDAKKRYAVMGGFENKQVVGYQNERDLNWRVDAISFRVSKRDVLDLPPVSHETRVCELSGQARAVYEGLKKDLYAMVMEGVEVTAANALVKVLRLLQVTSGCVESDDGTKVIIDDSKIRMFRDIMEDMPEKEPMVVFSRFTRDIDIVVQALAEMGRSCAVLDGRKNQLAEWKRGEFDDIVIQIRAGGAGVDLTRACYATYYTQTHSLGDYEQSLARLDRPGQTRPVTYYHLVCAKTVDEQIYRALQEKRDVVNYILEGIKHGVSVAPMTQAQENELLMKHALGDALAIFGHKDEE